MSESVSITWWGHATTTIELAGQRLLTDPVLTRRLAHLSRIGGAVPGPTALDADAAVISHLHHDHLHPPSLRRLHPRTRIIGPYGTAVALRRSAPEIAERVEEMGPGQTLEVGDVLLRAVPANHDGRRSPLSSARGPALGFVLDIRPPGGPQRVWFAGDTGLFDGMSGLGPVDVAVVPIGGWGPTLGPTHLDPAQAAEAVRRVRARDAVPIHYGTFWPTGLRRVHPARFRSHFLEPGEAFSVELAALCPDTRAHVIAHAATIVIPVRVNDE